MVDNMELFKKCMMLSREIRSNGNHREDHRGDHRRGEMPPRPHHDFRRPEGPRFRGEMPPMPPRPHFGYRRPAGPYYCYRKPVRPHFHGGMAPMPCGPRFWGEMPPMPNFGCGRPMGPYYSYRKPVRPHFHGGMPSMPQRPHFEGELHRGPHAGGRPGRGRWMSRERLLAILANHEEGMWQKDLAREAGINPSSASEFISRLEADGFLTRTVDENDRRAVRLALTDAGKERAEAVKAERESNLEGIFAKLTEEEKQTLSDLLDKLMS